MPPHDAKETARSLPNAGDRYLDEINADANPDDGDVPAAIVEPTSADLALLGAALSILLDNRDIVRWATCLVESWSPEMAGLDLVEGVLALLTRDSNGILPMSVTFIDRPPTGNTSATMYAFTNQSPNSDGLFGLIIPLESNIWGHQSSEYEAGQNTAFCAAVQVAATLLHELIHIVGDGFRTSNYTSPFSWTNFEGANHEVEQADSTSTVTGTDFPCWDEPRMTSTMFLWALSQRFPCLTDSSVCQNMSDNRYLAYSTSTGRQLRNS